MCDREGAACGYAATHDEHALFLDGDLWRELVLTGHWIEDAIILCWAEFTSRLADNEVTVSTVVSHLLLDQELLHKTADARDVFASHSEVRCVWTDDVVTKGFAIDHVLPFSLWRSNDLWNLLSAHPR